MTAVDKIVKKYKTRNPLELASAMGILVFFEPLGSINGYFTTYSRIKSIHINEDLEGPVRDFTIAHELAHCVLHPRENTHFLRSHTYFSVDKLEIQANDFAVNLLIADDDLMEYQGYTIGQLASVFGLSKELISLRVKKLL